MHDNISTSIGAVMTTLGSSSELLVLLVLLVLLLTLLLLVLESENELNPTA